MSPENKQRIVGGIVLVAFIALLIPFLFTSGIKKKAESTANNVALPEAQQQAAAAVPPIANQSDSTKTAVANASAQDISNTIPPPATTTAGQKPMPTVAPPAPTDAAQQSLPLPSADSAMPPEMSAEAAPTPATASTPAAPAPAKSTDSGVAKKEPLPEKAVALKEEQQQAATPAVSKQATTSKSVKGKAGTKTVQTSKPAHQTAAVNNKAFWTVQIGSFTDQARIQQLAKQLRAKGYRVYTQKITTTRSNLTRILVGHEHDKAQADKVAKSLATNMKLHGQVIKVNK